MTARGGTHRDEDAAIQSQVARKIELDGVIVNEADCFLDLWSCFLKEKCSMKSLHLSKDNLFKISLTILILEEM